MFRISTRFPTTISRISDWADILLDPFGNYPSKQYDNLLDYTTAKRATCSTISWTRFGAHDRTESPGDPRLDFPAMRGPPVATSHDVRVECGRGEVGLEDSRNDGVLCCVGFAGGLKAIDDPLLG